MIFLCKAATHLCVSKACYCMHRIDNEQVE